MPTTWAERIWAVLFIGPMVLLLFECWPLENTLGGLSLFFWGFASGLTFAVFIIPLWRIIAHKWGPPLDQGLGFFVLFWCGSMCGAYVASASNRHWSAPVPRTIAVSKVDQRIVRGKGGPSYYFFIENQGRRERLQLSCADWTAMCEAKTLKLTVVDGFWGYPVIMRIDPYSEF